MNDQKIEPKLLVLLDPGHSGIVNGQYVTPGKRSPKFDDGHVYYEGVQNRIIVKKIKALLDAENIDNATVALGEEDIPLKQRVDYANMICKSPTGKSCLYISIHSDAMGDGSTWQPASGISVYTSVGQTNSDIFASMVLDKLSKHVSNVKWRRDDTDGDPDKEENYYVLKNTRMPAILCELGFHTNKEECARMETPEWQDACANSIFEAVKDWIKLNNF